MKMTMKKIHIYLFLAVMLIAAPSCKKFFDINKNPNRPTEGIAEEVILPKIIVAWANALPGASAVGEELVGYTTNAGGVSGWGSFISYKFTPGNGAALWSTPYDNLTDIKVVIDKAKADPNYALLGAAAKVMKAIHFQHLVDTYNNVPYTQANMGVEFVTPEYDNGPDIYKSLAELLDEAIADINGAGSAAQTLNAASDPLFKGNMTLWKQLANTIKLRLIIRGGDKVSFTNKTFSSDGFLAEDALVQPGYTNVDGKLNPVWSRVYTVAGAQVGGVWQQRVPSFYTLGFYDGNKISDKYRGNLVYRAYPSPGVNALGRDPGTDAAARVKTPNDWYISLAATPSATNYAAIGIVKGPSAAQPIMLASESFFLQAEGALRGIITGNVKDLFNRGILESFKYLNKNENGSNSSLFVNKTTGKLTTGSGTDIVAISSQNEFDEYLAEGLNATNRLVNYDLATSFEQRLEAIITQKYIALNNLFGLESWNEFRRTRYPVTVSPPTYPGTRYTSLVSLQSESTAADRLPTRYQYPQNEFNYNGANVKAQGGSGDGGIIDVFRDKIFWAK